jgi:D-alanyl-D-alanine carboxypeptidase
MMRFLRIAVMAAALGGALGTAAQADQSDDLRALLETFRETYDFPGATAAYALPDGTIVSAAVGFADVEAGIPMSSESRMLAASVGKTVWGALVLSLETEGVLDRSDLVSDYLGDKPWYPRLPNGETMTIWHLLTHTSGMPDHVYMEGAAMKLIELGQIMPFDPSDVIAMTLDAQPLFEPGKAWAYSDTGYLLLGMVIEEATNQNVFNLAEDRFLAFLGLRHTVPSNVPEIPYLAVGYTVQDNPFGLSPRTMDDKGALIWNPLVEWTGGGFASNSSDLAQWGRALFTGAAMDVPYKDRLLQGVAVHPDAPSIFYGAGVAIYEATPLGPVYGHGGWIPGYVSSLRHYADHQVTIAFQINSDVGVVDDSTDMVPALEAAIADQVLATLKY